MTVVFSPQGPTSTACTKQRAGRVWMWQITPPSPDDLLTRGKMTSPLTPEASDGRAELYRLFDLLRAAELKVQLLRDAGEPFSPELAQEWQSAYRLFVEAYEVWHRLMPDRP